MDAAWLMGLTGFSLALAATPGPNNTLAAAVAASHGIGRTLPLLAGIALGVSAIMFMVALFGTAVVADPVVTLVLKWSGVLYLLWLAWKVGSAEPSPPGADAGDPAGRPRPGTLQGVLLQLINPKLWLFVSGAVVAYGPGGQALGRIGLATLLALLGGGITFASVLAWALLGSSLGSRLKSRRAMRALNITMALLLVASLIPVVIG